jgi:hypothetical protein
MQDGKVFICAINLLGMVGWDTHSAFSHSRKQIGDFKILTRVLQKWRFNWDTCRPNSKEFMLIALLGEE